MELLYSNIKPCEYNDKGSFGDAFEKTVVTSDSIKIATGYITEESLLELKSVLLFYLEENKTKECSLVIGMHGREGFTRPQYEAAVELGSFLKEKNSNLQSIGVISSPNDFIPWMRSYDEVQKVWLFDKALYDMLIETNTQDAIHACCELVKNVGMLCGPTSGAVYHCIKQYFTQNPLKNWQTETCVFLACDRIEPYISYIKQRISNLIIEEPLQNT